MNRSINSKGYNVDRVQSRTSISGWLGTLEAAIVDYIYKNGLTRFQPIFLARDLNVDRRRVNDALKRLMARGAIIKITRGFYQVVKEVFNKLVDYPVRKLDSSVTRRGVKDKHETSPPWDKGGSRGGVGRVGSGVYVSGVWRGGGLFFDVFVGGGFGVDSSWFSVGSRFGVGAGSVGAGFAGGGDPLFFDHVVGFRSGDFVFGESGRLRWRDLVFFERVVSVEVGAYLDIPFWDGVLKVYWPRGEPRPVVEWQHPKDFLREHGLLDVRRVFWERLVDAIIGFSKLVLDGAPWWVVKRLLRELRALGVCRGVVHV